MQCAARIVISCLSTSVVYLVAEASEILILADGFFAISCLVIKLAVKELIIQHKKGKHIWRKSAESYTVMSMCNFGKIKHHLWEIAAVSSSLLIWMKGDSPGPGTLWWIRRVQHCCSHCWEPSLVMHRRDSILSGNVIWVAGILIPIVATYRFVDLSWFNPASKSVTA